MRYDSSSSVLTVSNAFAVVVIFINYCRLLNWLTSSNDAIFIQYLHFVDSVMPTRKCVYDIVALGSTGVTI